MRYFILSVFLCSLVLPVSAQNQNERDEYMQLFSVKGDYADVREDLEMAITDRGMIINNISHIGNMLARTRKDIGGKQIFGRAESLEFCSSVVSRHMMEADPRNIVFCPYIISIYTLPGEKNRVYLAYRRPLPVGSPASKKSLQTVEKMLHDIVSDVLTAE
ncbi:hypothetical protein MNBD_GAMMA24-1841 [hydrothermal vent metagenome]|uniref:Uncharacterized protein n=1 Tax=hydrothermal vent metagenome TaxID=652676 RepID=A0A3B1BDP4_9ZZZZ